MMWGAIAAGAAVVCLFAGAPAASADPERCAPVADQLACADLRGKDFIQADLAKADLHGAILRGVDLTQAELVDANLTGADLTGADLGQADLTGANLTDAVLRGADLTQAYLSGASARGADFADTELIQADLRGADLRDVDLRGADLTQAEVADLDLRGADLTDVESLDAAAVRLDEVSLEGHRQISWLVFWPALAFMVNWWRARIGHLVRHHPTTPVRPAEVVVASAAVVFAVVGGYLLATGAVRGIARASMAWLPTADPGPLAVVGADPLHQLISGATAVGIAIVLFPLSRLRRLPLRRATGTGQVVIGARVAVGRPPAVSGPVQWVAVLAAAAGMVDLFVVTALKIAGELPVAGPWADAGVWGHLATVALATVFLVRLSLTKPGRSSSRLASLSGVVLAAGGREPYVLASGKTENRVPMTQVLPWHALTHVHLIRTLGTPRASQAMVMLRQPGVTGPVEYGELPITAPQLTRLRETLPPEMINDVVRAPAAE